MKHDRWFLTGATELPVHRANDNDLDPDVEDEALAAKQLVPTAEGDPFS